KYTSPALTQKVFANMRRVGKWFSGVETPLFEGMLVEQEVDEEGDADENVEKVNAGDAAKGDVSAAHGEVPTVTEEQSILSPTLSTPPPQPPQDIPLTSQVQQTPPQSPQVQPPSPQPQPQPQQAAKFPMSLLQETMDTCAALTRRVEHLEFDKVAQALKITKLKRRTLVETSSLANKVLSMQEDETEPAKVQEVVDVVTTVKLITEVVTAASETVTAASEIITTAEAQVPTATLIVAPARVTDAPNENVEKVNAGDAAKGDVSAAHGEVPTVTEEQSILSPTLSTPPPQPPQDIPLTSQGRMIAKIDQDDAVVLEDDKEEDREVVDAVKDVEKAKVDESAQD
nr:hypothetical protein [Tanacetum cinerariifolium]